MRLTNPAACVCLAVLSACIDPPAEPEAVDSRSHELESTHYVNLVPDFCTWLEVPWVGEGWTDCVDWVDIDALSAETAVPNVSLVTLKRQGDCKSMHGASRIFFEYQMPEGGSVGHDPFDRIRTREVRRFDRGATDSLRIRSIAGQPVWLPKSCRIDAEVTLNRVDIHSRIDARDWIAGIEREIDEARAEVTRLEELLQLVEAYDFLTVLADNFRVELTSQTTQELRGAALDGQQTLQDMLLDPNCSGGLAPEDQQNMFTLAMSLVALGDPAQWENPDGSAKTLEQFLGPDAQAIEATLDELLDQRNRRAQYEQDLVDAVDEVARLEAKLALAEQELAQWLN